MIALFSPHWLISPLQLDIVTTSNLTLARHPSFGLNSRCKMLSNGQFACNTFVFNHANWPIAWKLSWLLMIFGFFLIALTSAFTAVSLCRQSLCGKSLHTITGSLQILSGIFVLISTFFYPLGFEHERISSVCIDMSYFHPGECSFGYAFYAAVLGIVLAMLCGLLSLKVEKATLNPSIKRRIEEGNERLVFARWAHNTTLNRTWHLYWEIPKSCLLQSEKILSWPGSACNIFKIGFIVVLFFFV